VKRARVALVAAGLLVVACALRSGPGFAQVAGSPFYLVPSPTTECLGVANCVANSGPWVMVPANSEATYLFGCPKRRSFTVGGTDARGSSPQVRVWFDGALGAPIGSPPAARAQGAVLLFHAETNNGEAGSFQPIVGCVSLVTASKIATVSLLRAARLPGTPTSSPLDLRAQQFVLAPTSRDVGTESCGKGEKLVGSWSAVAFNTTQPPDPSYAHAVSVSTSMAGNKVHARFRIMLPTLLTPLAPETIVQIGAMCER
jgi:hypothetical protein